MAEEVMRCEVCGKILRTHMEIEWSKELNEFYCSPDCATTRYFDYLDSRQLEPDNFEEIQQYTNVLVKNGKYYYYDDSI